MKLRIEKSPQAKLDIGDIEFHIRQFRPSASNRFLKQVQKALDLLAEFPEMGTLWTSSHPRLSGIRYWKLQGFKKYVIIYRPESDHIKVLRVLHGARDLKSLIDS